MIDPMADKALMTVVTICLAVKDVLPGKSTMPVSSSHTYNSRNQPANTNTLPAPSPPSNPHPWPRRSPRPLSLLLPLHFPPTSSHLGAILGLLSPERGGATDADIEDQYLLAVGIVGGDNEWIGGGGARRDGAGAHGG